ncbi:Octopamine receptor beta-1R [Trichoplax sp. H2]|nr:Octopamine receptor beta-1R [Trichoplax sp. H2]|eukprot:RDD47226.1 Octopamine receptor beta-1R [Trichoplax sp. H2]
MATDSNERMFELNGEVLPKIISLGILLVVCLLANASLFITIISQRKLRTIDNSFLASFAFSSLLLALLQMLPLVVSGISTFWPFGTIFCNLSYSISIFLSSSSVLHVLAIGICRFTIVMYPLTYHYILTKKVTITMFCYIWLQPFIIGFLPSVAWRNITETSDSTVCNQVALIVRYIQHERIYSIFVVAINFALSCIIIIFLYTSIFATAYKQRRRLKNTALSLNFRVKNRENNHICTSLIHGITMTIYIISWVIFHTLSLVLISNDNKISDALGKFLNAASLISVYLIFTNLSICPFIYGLLTVDIRTAMTRRFCFRRKEIRRCDLQKV